MAEIALGDSIENGRREKEKAKKIRFKDEAKLRHFVYNKKLQISRKQAAISSMKRYIVLGHQQNILRAPSLIWLDIFHELKHSQAN